MELSKKLLYEKIINSINLNNRTVEFEKYLNTRKTYIYKVGNKDIDRVDFLEIRVYYKRKFLTCTLKSVYDKSLIKQNLPFHSDGHFNRHQYLFNTQPTNRWFPESVMFKFEDNLSSFSKSIKQLNNDLNNQGEIFFDIDLKSNPIFLTGTNYINTLKIDKDNLATELDKETIEGRFFKRIKNETFNNLVKTLDIVWLFTKEDYLKDYSLEDKKYYLTFNLLYYYINLNAKKIKRNLLYQPN